MAEQKDKHLTKFTEEEIQKKLYGNKKNKNDSALIPIDQEHHKKTEIIKKTQPDEQIILKEKDRNNEILEEIIALKKGIEQLENKLKKTENQKERLKKKLVQKRIITKTQETIYNVIINQIKNKLVLLLSAIIIILSILIMAKFSQKKESMPEENNKIDKLDMPVVETKQILTPAAGKNNYTLQVAEYGNEEKANKFVEELRGKGFLVSMDTYYRDIKKEKPYFKINVGEFATIEEAKKFKGEFADKTAINDAFIKELKK